MQPRTAPEHPTQPEARPTRARRAGLVAGVLLVALAALGCDVPVEKWVPDFNGDGAITEDEVIRQRDAIARQVAASVEQKRREIQAHPFLTCVRRHESDRGGAYPYVGGYSAQNPYSTASGAYQFLDSTWRNVAPRAGHPGYARAMHAPWYVQDAVALWLVNNGGRSAWNGTGC